MSGYRVDHNPFGHAHETTWAHDGQPYTRESAEAYAESLGKSAVWWFDCEMWPVDRGPRPVETAGEEAARMVRETLCARFGWLRLDEEEAA